MKLSIEYSQLEKIANNLKRNCKKENTEKFFNNTSRILAKKLYKELWSRTPVITGFLRHGWNVGLSSKYQNARFYPKNPVLFPKLYKDEYGNIDKNKSVHYHAVDIDIKKIVPNKDGNKYTIHFRNPVSYAPFVEYGHRVTAGGRKPPIGKVKLFATNEYITPFKEGHHMTYEAVEKIKSEAPKIVRKEFNKFIRGGK